MTRNPKTSNSAFSLDRDVNGATANPRQCILHMDESSPSLSFGRAFPGSSGVGLSLVSRAILSIEACAAVATCAIFGDALPAVAGETTIDGKVPKANANVTAMLPKIWIMMCGT